ncbi:MAG: NAD-dependent epimerase/dehydratase family protein [Micrococcales bacterium]|nr:NAD-dependent epimerase/dehydratase family protein [Micrococcales bacterium]
MTVAVVGGSGFIGTRLITLLRQAGHTVSNLDLQPSATHPDVTTIGDVRDPDAVRTALTGASAVVLLAAAHRDDVRPVSEYESVNVGGARVVAEVAAQTGVDRVVFTSTVSVYGLDKDRPSETSPPDPFNEYGRTKLVAESVLEEWVGQPGRDTGRTLFVVRPCVVFGETNRGNVYTLAHQLATGRFLFVGDGRNHKAMAYVGNVAAFLATGLTAAPGHHLVNYADTPDLSTTELVELMKSDLGRHQRTLPPIPKWLGLAAGHGFDALAWLVRRPLPISAVRIRKFCAETTVDTTRLHQTGFAPPFTLTDALHQTLAAEFPDGHVPA